MFPRLMTAKVESARPRGRSGPSLPRALPPSGRRGAMVLAVGLQLAALALRAQVPVTPIFTSQNDLIYNTNLFRAGLLPGASLGPMPNWLSVGGLPITSANDPKGGSNGRAPTPATQLADGGSTNVLLYPTNPPSPGQFRALMSIAGVATVARGGLLTPGAVNFAQDASNLGWPVARDKASHVVSILRSAQVAPSFVNSQTTYPLGSELPPPVVSETGVPLTNGLNFVYWQSAPLGWNTLTNAGYYYSTNANALFAIEPGPVTVVWIKVGGATNVPANLLAGFGIWTNSYSYYVVATNTYLVSSAPVKPPQNMYWTEGAYADTGYPVTVPKAAVDDVNIIYGDASHGGFPQFVAAPGDPLALLASVATNTFWFDRSLNEFRADNAVGQVFLELLGELLPGGSRAFLGFEIVRVSQAPSPVDINVPLGTRIGAYQDGRSDAGLTAAPLSGTSGFYYRQNLPNNVVNLYATTLTVNTNDFQSYWLAPGVAGLLWPALFDRYHEYWPGDPAMYVHYARPAMSNALAAAATAVQLPPSEAASIAFQDNFPQDPTVGATLTSAGGFATYVDAAYPTHRTLLQFLSGNNVAYERVFSWLDASLVNNALLAGSVATNLAAWNPASQTLTFPNPGVGPYVLTNTVNVGDRLKAPARELGSASGSSYLAGQIIPSTGTCYHPGAYVDPVADGFTAASLGAIIPVNAIPGNNTLEVIWYRPDSPNTTLGFQPSYWPTAVGYYQVQWPVNPTNEIILASNAGTKPLDSYPQAALYVQSDPTQPGYNPNEEHALLLGNTAFALRDDLNLTSGAGGYLSSAPFVLIDYVDPNGRPNMVAFHVRREAPEQGILFDYVAAAGLPLQPPMPLPFLPSPVATVDSRVINLNQEPPRTSTDWPANWQNLPADSPLAYYGRFTFEDRKHDYWVYRGPHAGLPPLQLGAYNSTNHSFGPLPPATALVNTNFTYYFHFSRQWDNLIHDPDNPVLPKGLTVIQDAAKRWQIAGIPATPGSNTYTLTFHDTDLSSVSASLSLNVVTSGTVVAQAPLSVTSTNPYSGNTVTYSNRAPFLAVTPTTANSFTMRYYYVNQQGFDWPGIANPPTNGAIVPYLLPAGTDASTAFQAEDPSQIPSLDVVYRPTWPDLVSGLPVPTLYSGQTQTVPTPNSPNMPDVLHQQGVQVLYQQSIATNDITQPDVYRTVALIDPTVEKKASLAKLSTAGPPASVPTNPFEGLVYFATLPPNLAQRIWYDPGSTNLVFAGVFQQQAVGDSYLELNVLNGAALDAVNGLCDPKDPDYGAWVQAVAALGSTLETFGEALDAQGDPIPGTYVAQTNLDQPFTAGQLVVVTNADQRVNNYALATTGPGLGWISWIVNNSMDPTQSGNPVTVKVARVSQYAQAPTNTPGLYPGQIAYLPDQNPLSEQVAFQHKLDLGGNTANYKYDWRIIPQVEGQAPTTDPIKWPVLTNGPDLAVVTLSGGASIQALVDNCVVVRYQETDPHALPGNTNWSAWSQVQFSSGYIKRVLEGINPFEQVSSNLFDNAVNTSASILTTAGHRWEGDVALNGQSLTNVGLIALYETVLNRGKALSLDVGINFGPANDALLLAAGEISDLYTYVANDAAADAANPTIGIGTQDSPYGDVATALFSFEGEEPSLLEEDLALLRGRDDSSTAVTEQPVYNRLYWNYTYGIADGEVIYALNYDIQDENNDGRVDAADAAIMFPMGHGDAYGHYLTALNNYYQLLLNPYFDWVPTAEGVSVLGAQVVVNYQHERKFAASASALAGTGLKAFDLTWKEGYHPGTSAGWSSFDPAVVQPQPRVYYTGTGTVPVTRYWGLDHWASRVAQGAFVNWIVGNAILPAVDPDPSHEGIEKVDRTTVPELNQLPRTASQLQTDMNNAEAGFTPFDLPQNAIPFDINPLQVTGTDPQTHFEQIYSRALVALNNAVAAFNDAEHVTEEMRSQVDSLADLQAGAVSQELAYNNQLIELYGTPYPEDMGPNGAYPQGYTGPDLIHYTYVNVPGTNTYGGILPDPRAWVTNYIDIQSLPPNWSTHMYSDFNAILASTAPGYVNASNSYAVPLVIGPDGFLDKPAGWSTRSSPGQIQQAISSYMAAQDAYRVAADTAIWDKQALDKAQNVFNSLVVDGATTVNDLNDANIGLATVSAAETSAWNIADRWLQNEISTFTDIANTAAVGTPVIVIGGLADGGDVGAPVRGSLYSMWLAAADTATAIDNASFTAYQAAQGLQQAAMSANSIAINQLNLDASIKNAVVGLGQQELALQGDVITIDQKARAASDAYAAYQALVAKGLRIQEDRAAWRQHAAALVQGYRTRDAAFRLFQNEKLERYLTLFNLAGEYAFLAAQAYDYETGLLGTSQGQAFLNELISAQALGVVSDGIPQYSSTTSGDPGLAGALAQMKGDWDVLKGRLGFNNPDGNGTTVSLRTENYRVLPGTNGDLAWQGVLQQARVPDITADADVSRLCLQVADPSGAPVPGIILNFSTTVTRGLNLFGQQLAAGDHDFTPSTFATKIFAVGVCLDAYIGMDNPAPGGGVVHDPSTDPNGLAATPYVYLIPVGQDSMRSPPLGDAGNIRSWNVADIAVPLPFNVSAADFASTPFYTSANSLTEPLFTVREHEAFRPVSTLSVFSPSIYGATGALQPSEYTNQRLIGRSIWNSQWKLVIPGGGLLADPNAGLDRFIQSVKDIHLYFITYSYAGN